MDCIKFRNVTVNYDRHPALHHVSGGFALGSLTAVAGPNGGGKSTLLKAISGDVKPESGEIVFTGICRADLAYLPQMTEIQRDFPLTILQMVASGSWRRCGGFGGIDRATRRLASQALETVGLAGFEDRSCGSLSAGQFQRALFARLSLQDAKVILLDEPFSAIDEDTSAQLMQYILRWNKEGRTVICVLHDAECIRRYFPQTVLLARECIAWGETPEVISAANHHRTRFFNAAWPSHAELCEIG